MKHCPNCGHETNIHSSACECGELLRAEVTQVLGAWETETMFRPAAAVNKNRIVMIAVVLAVAAFGLVLAAPKMLESFNGMHSAVDQQPRAAIVQNPTESDLVPADDLVTSDNQSSVKSADGAFDFAPAGTQQNIRERKPVARTLSDAPDPSKANTTDTLDAQLLSTSPESSNTETLSNNADCKPTITAALKRPEPVVPTDEKTSVKTGSSYTLGPRGGCFFVTAGGSKKYVDRNLCGQAVTAAARQ
jgi:hypothetical protein